MNENERKRGASSGPMSDEDSLIAYAAEKIFGRRRWEYMEEGPDGTMVWHSGPIPPDSAWARAKPEALAAARVHRRLSTDFELVTAQLVEARGDLEELAAAVKSGDAGEAQACIVAVDTGLWQALHMLSGILRDGYDGDDMDIEMTNLCRAIFDGMVALNPDDELPQQPGSAGEETA